MKERLNLEVLIHFMLFASIAIVTFRHQQYVVVPASRIESIFYRNKSVKTVCSSTVFHCYSRVTEISAYMRLSLGFLSQILHLCLSFSVSHFTVYSCSCLFICALTLFFLFHFISISLFLLSVCFLTSSFPLPLRNCVKVTEIGREIG